jgi:hypothetical protein
MTEQLAREQNAVTATLRRLGSAILDRRVVEQRHEQERAPRLLRGSSLGM